jgi:hypothetical protein
MANRKKERIFISDEIVHIQLNWNIIQGCVLLQQDWVERDCWDRIKDPEFHPGAPCSLSLQLQMPILY